MKRSSLITSVIAASLGLSIAAHGATVTLGSNKYSKEHSERAVALGSPTTVGFRRIVDAGAAARFPKILLSSAINAGDTITLTLGGTAGANFATTSSITLYCDSTDDDNPTDAGGAEFRAITAATAPTTTGFSALATNNCSGAKEVYVTGGALTNASLQTLGTITLAATVTRAGAAVDTAAEKLQAEVVQELSVSIGTGAGFNAQIDNSNGNKSFGGTRNAPETTRLERLTVSYTDVDVFDTTDVTPATDDAVVVTLSGDFNYLDDDGTAGCIAGDLTGDVGRFAVTNGTVAVDAACSTLTVTHSAAQSFTATSATFDIVLNGADLGANNWLRPQTFTGSAVLKWTAASSAIAQTRSSALTPGALSGTGATVFIPYMPVGPTVSQILYITNTANVAGTVTLSAYDDAGVACGTAAFGGNIAVGARRVTNLASALAAGLAACGGASTSKKLYLTITASLPDSAIEVYSAYNVGGSDRANVANSSNGRATATGMGNANSNGAN